MLDQNTNPETSSKPASLRKFAARAKSWIEGEAIKDIELPEKMPSSPFEMARTPITIGLCIIAIFFGALFFWGSFAPLKGAAIASGVVAVDSSRKEVQHLEGGIVKAINAWDGKRVVEGEVLIQLDDTRTSASVDLLLGQYRSAVARVASLQAEQMDLDMPNYPAELSDNLDDVAVAEIVESQNNLFLSRKASQDGQVDVLRQQVRQFEEERAGLEAQKESEEEQLELITEEVKGVEELFNKGNAPKTRLLELQREASRIKGEIGQYRAQISRANQSILQNELSIQDLNNQFKSDSAEQLRQAETEQADLAERLRATENQQQRTDIIAPTSGTVVNMQTHTIGGVIQGGETVLEIVPLEDLRIVEARINPRDIDEVSAQQEAQVVLTAYNSRRTPYLAARIDQVSADILQDSVTGEMFYEARVIVEESSLDEFPDIELYPGMPVEVMIATNERTALQYLIAPLRSTLRRGAKES